MIIEGNISVKAAVLAGRRNIVKVLVDQEKKDKDTNWILHRCDERNIPVERVSREWIETIAEGKTHGGLIAEVKERTYQSIEDTLHGNPFVVLLEGIEDPFNLGYVMRTLYSAGCTGIILRERNWDNALTTILKSSAGAEEYINIVMTKDPASLVREYKKRGLHAYAAMRKDAISCYEADYTGPVLLAIGGEMRGLSSSVLKETETNIFIPYANDFHNALNASSACAVLGFEVFRQREKE